MSVKRELSVSGSELWDTLAGGKPYACATCGKDVYLMRKLCYLFEIVAKCFKTL